VVPKKLLEIGASNKLGIATGWSLHIVVEVVASIKYWPGVSGFSHSSHSSQVEACTLVMVNDRCKRRLNNNKKKRKSVWWFFSRKGFHLISNVYVFDGVFFMCFSHGSLVYLKFSQIILQCICYLLLIYLVLLVIYFVVD